MNVAGEGLYPMKIQIHDATLGQRLPLWLRSARQAARPPSTKKLFPNLAHLSIVRVVLIHILKMVQCRHHRVSLQKVRFFNNDRKF